MRVGEYTLVERMAAGGFGAVWLGRSRRGVPVAVKVLTPEGAQDPETVDALLAEGRLTASLDHPHVIGIYDQGRVTTEAASGGALVADTPWLALELATGGSLRQRATPWTWEEVRGALLQLLSGLAHAHAAGVLHRDVKPDNVLLGGLRPGLKLTDFGIGYATKAHLDHEAGAPIPAGTLAYMAPEQHACDAAEQGPWTDVYAVGGLGWRIVTGQLPFGRTKATHHELERKKLARATDPFQPTIAVPPGFEEWLRTALAPRPADRFRAAVDAATALRGVGRVQVPVAAPTDWRDVEPDADDPIGRAAGPGLCDARQATIVGREDLRDALWDAWRAVHRAARPRAVVLRGPSGTGKSHLARWIAARAHESAGADVFTAHHGEPTTRHDGVAGLLARALRCHSADPADRLRRLGARLDELGADGKGLARAVDAILGSGARDVTIGLQERYGVVEEVVARTARGRPAVVLLDDVQWGLDALRFAAHALEVGPPALYVLTVRDEALPERPDEDEAIEALEARPDVASLGVAPLDRNASVTLLRRLLRVDEGLADLLAERSNGNPLFAVQLLRECIDRELLVDGPRGLALRDGAVAPLPASLAEVWQGRVRRALWPDVDRLAAPLELAATLGKVVWPGEWAAACREAGTTPARDLVLRLLGERLATHNPSSGSWSFVHDMLREAILQQARAAGRLASHHRACAAVLAAQARPDSQARLGRHALAAGEPALALEPLRLGARHAVTEGRFVEGLRLLEEREQALASAAVPESDAAWAKGWVDLSRTALWAGDLPRCAASARKAADLARAHGHVEAEAGALVLLAESPPELVPPDLARAAAERALSLTRGREDEVRVLALLVGARIGAHGDAALAVARLEEALPLAARLGGDLTARCFYLLTLLALDRAAFDEAGSWVERLAAEAERLGSAAYRCTAALTRADLTRLRGRTAEAALAYDHAAAQLAACMDPVQWLARALGGCVSAELGDGERARGMLARVIEADRRGVALGHLGLVLVSAADPTDPAFDRHLAEVSRRVAAGWRSPQLVRWLGLAAERAHDAGLADRATRCRALLGR